MCCDPAFWTGIVHDTSHSEPVFCRFLFEEWVSCVLCMGREHADGSVPTSSVEGNCFVSCVRDGSEMVLCCVVLEEGVPRW